MESSLSYFKLLPERYPEHEKSRKAADSVLSFYDKKKDYNELKTYGLKYLSNPKLAVAPYKERWRSVRDRIEFLFKKWALILWT